ncbi:MAG: hypothetical protein AB1627_11940, partial [Chloroflexota bacterium]
MQLNHRMIRSIGTSIVALFLVAGAAFATSTFMSAPAADSLPAGLSEDATDDASFEAETEEPTATDGTEDETAEPTGSLET